MSSTQRHLISKTKLSIFALGISCMTVTMLKFVFFYNKCWCFIVNICLVLSNGYSESGKITVFSFHLLMWCTTTSDFFIC